MPCPRPPHSCCGRRQVAPPTRGADPYSASTAWWSATCAPPSRRMWCLWRAPSAPVTTTAPCSRRATASTCAQDAHGLARASPRTPSACTASCTARWAASPLTARRGARLWMRARRPTSARCLRAPTCSPTRASCSPSCRRSPPHRTGAGLPAWPTAASSTRCARAPSTQGVQAPGRCAWSALTCAPPPRALHRWWALWRSSWRVGTCACTLRWESPRLLSCCATLKRRPFGRRSTP